MNHNGDHIDGSMTVERLAQIIEFDKQGTDVGPAVEHRRELLREVALLTYALDDIIKEAPKRAQDITDRTIVAVTKLLRAHGHTAAADHMDRATKSMLAADSKGAER